MPTKIQWCDRTINPIHLIREDGSHGGHWCRKISPGCANCYAEEQNQSNYFKFASHLKYSGAVPENLIFNSKVMEFALKLKKPERIFIGSMTDVGGDWVPEDSLDRMFAYMALARHTFQILTKRPERMRDYLRSSRQRLRIAIVDLGRELGLKPESYEAYETFEFDWPLQNIWLGTSVENQKAADDRIPQLLQTPAAIRFLSCEPLLEQVTLDNYLPYLDWIIVGGESGPSTRQCNTDWIRSIVHQCRQTKTAVFVKQLGSNPVQTACYIDGIAVTYQKLKLKDRKGGDIEEFPIDLQLREFPHE